MTIDSISSTIRNTFTGELAVGAENEARSAVIKYRANIDSEETEMDSDEDQDTARAGLVFPVQLFKFFFMNCVEPR